MSPVARNERGMALIITLMVVAILTIIVTEFTFSAQVDQHMVHNSLSGLQASLLARSGINMGEAFLLHDNDPSIDAFTEEWCPLPGPRGESCLIDETNSGIVIPENMRLRVQIFDEGAKFNVNLTKPTNVAEYKNAIARANVSPPNEATMRPFERRRLLLGEILQAFGLEPEALENLQSFWNRSYEQLCQEQLGLDPYCGQLPGAPGTPGPQGRVGQYKAPDFSSLDDIGVIPGFTPALLRRSRPYVTAFDTTRTRFANAPVTSTTSPINLNTVPRRLLEILLGDAGTVDNIISEREQAPIKNPAALVQPAVAALAQDPARQGIASLFTYPTSSLFLIRASAIINANPLTGKGGIGRTASVIVRRDPKPGAGPNTPPGVSRWVLTRIEWHKEGGAALFREDLDADLLGAEGSPSEVF